jgi:ligand-binding SRPBCC domain-containing protein
VPTVERTSTLAADADTVWSWVTTATGVNDELRPWIRMTVPRGWRDRALTDVAPGTRIGRSWLLFLGVVPFDADDITIAELGERSFVERSPLLSAAAWEHDRRVTPTAGGCTLVDRLTFMPRALTARIPGGTRLNTAVVAAIFDHRHRRLHRRFGTA